MYCVHVYRSSGYNNVIGNTRTPSVCVWGGGISGIVCRREEKVCGRGKRQMFVGGREEKL